MTAIPRSIPTWRPRPLVGLRAIVRSRTDEPAWVRVAFVGVIALAALLYLWNLAVSGYANTYYSAAALAAGKSWSAFFFGSFDAANFITVDKPPAAIWLMGLSVRLFGLSSWSVLLPQALAGILTVGILFAAVRRSFGPVAAVIAGVVMALTPAAVLIFRYNNPDALLTLLLVAGAWALLRAIEHGRLRWVALAATCVGFAFLTKYLQAYLVLPGFALVYLVAANTTLRRRLVGLLLAAITVLVTSGWWVAIVALIPAASRPFIGGSTTGSVLDLIFGYDGLGRIFGDSAGGTGNNAGFGGTAGLLRLFNDAWFGEIAWFIPPALASLGLGLWLRRRAGRTDRALAGYLLWGTWLVTTGLVFSYMSGTVHSYYAVALAPAIAALVGAGVAELWRLRARHWLGGAALAAGFVGTAGFGWQLLSRTPDFAPGVGPIAVALAVVAAVVLLLTSVPRLRDSLGRLAGAAAALGLCAVLLAPTAYAVSTVQTAYSSGDPHPGPGTTNTGFGGGGAGPGGSGGDGTRPALAGTAPTGSPPNAPTGTAPTGTSVARPGGSGMGNASADSALVSYLVANRGSATWIVAATSAQEAGPLELATGLPVMAMGGFTGSDPAPTLDQLKAYVASGQLRYVLAGGGNGGGNGGGGGSDATASDRNAWVTSACTLVDYGGSGTSTLYDCAGAS
jgi:4-amino-4-deoxy-L-arabinose transferase-like glycosyltransferase